MLIFSIDQLLEILLDRMASRISSMSSEAGAESSVVERISATNAIVPNLPPTELVSLFRYTCLDW